MLRTAHPSATSPARNYDAASAAHSAGILAAAYPHVGGINGALIRWRPYICPFADVLGDIPLNASVLDIGCGTGVACVLAAHLRRAHTVIGVDTLARSIRIAQRAIVPSYTSASFRHVTHADPWPTDTVSTVLCIDVLHHIPRDEQRAFVRALSRLNFTDRIILKDVSPHDWKAFGSRAHDLLIARERISMRCEHEAARWFEEEGLQVRGPRRLDLLWYGHYVIVAERRRRTLPTA